MPRESNKDDYHVNAEDGLELNSLDDVDENRIDNEQFPRNLIVTGCSAELFEDDELKRRFETLFLIHGQDAQFHYFKSFKRVRVTYVSPASAIRARRNVHSTPLGECILKCYFGQPPPKQKDDDGFLHPPTPDKQFLISPPASPPVDWEPRPESHPTLNYDLISAIAKLAPGEAHELHKPESEQHPSIVVHIAGEQDFLGIDNKPPQKPKIIQTKRPET